MSSDLHHNAKGEKRENMVEQLVAKRYGDEGLSRVVEDDNGVIRQMLSHHSVRKYTDEMIDDDTVRTLLAAAQSASTSSSLQAFSIIEIRDEHKRDVIAELSSRQDFIRKASRFFVFVADFSRNKMLFEHSEDKPEAIAFLDSAFVGIVDAVIAAQNMLLGAESLGFGGVYVGALRNHADKISELLELPQLAFPVVGLALGKPAPFEGEFIKPRMPQSMMHHIDRYEPSNEEAIRKYDERIQTYYSSQGSNRDWMNAVMGRLVHASSLHGREHLKKTVLDAGFDLQ